MSEDLDNAVGSLSEHTRKLEIATHYAHGDTERAKQMIAGTYKDVYVIKAHFSSTTMDGAFILFFNNIYSYLNGDLVLLSNDMDSDDFKTNQDWHTFEMSIVDVYQEKAYDIDLSKQFRDGLMSGFSFQFQNDMKKLVEQGDEIAVNRLFQKLIKERLGYQNVNISVDIEEISSIDMEERSKISNKLDFQELEKKKEQEKKKSEENINVEEDDPLAGREVKLVLKGGLLLSPIKGIEISKLKVGDRVRISIIDRHAKAIQVAKAFNAYREGEFLPISGRIISIVHHVNGGFVVHCVVAKGIYVVIEEEEESIKVAIDTPGTLPVNNQKETGMAARIITIVILVIVFIALVGIIIAFIQ